MNVASLNLHMFQVVVVVELGEDVGLRLVVKSTQLNAASRQSGIDVHHRYKRAKIQPTARQSLQEAMAGCLRCSNLM